MAVIERRVVWHSRSPLHSSCVRWEGCERNDSSQTMGYADATDERKVVAGRRDIDASDSGVDHQRASECQHLLHCDTCLQSS